MSITFPTFIDKEIVTPEKLNDFVQALEAKFAAGLSSAEIVWPLDAGGDLQMGDHEITGGQAIWGVYNADQYTDDWDSCLSDAGSGGCIVIPPNTTVVMDASAMAGSSLTIKGSGPSSILQLEAGATGTFALRNSTSGFSFKLENLTVDGADIGSNRGIILQGADGVVIHNVLFKDFPLSALYLTSAGGVGCSGVQITDNSFEGGASYQIEGDDVADLVIKGNNFKTASKTAIMLEASGATADMLRIEVEGNNFFGCTGDVISILGADGNFNAPQSHIRVAGNKANNLNGIKVGSATAKLQYVSISDNIVPSSYDNGLMVCAKYGTISGNVMPGATDDGLDLLDSQDLVVKGNSFRDSGEAGIRFLDAEDCLLVDNDCTDSTTRIVISDSITSPCRHYGNTDDTPEAGVVSAWRVDSDTFDIPANTLKIGDVLNIHAMWTDNTLGTQGVRVGGTYIVSHTSDGSGETTVIASLHVEDATTLKAMATMIPDSDDVNSSGPSIAGLDFTSTVSVSIIGADNTNQEMTVSIARGVSI